MHPTALEISDFARGARHAAVARRWEWAVRLAPLALAAGVAMMCIGGWMAVRSPPILLARMETSVAPVADDPTANRASTESTRPPAPSNAAPINALEEASVEPVRTASTATPRPSKATLPLSSAREWVGSVKLDGGTDTPVAIAEENVGPRFVAGEPVHLVTDLKDPPRNIPLRVVWFGPHGRKVREETNWTREGEKSAEFTAPTTRGWPTGSYRAELWVAGSKIRQQAFQITQSTQPK